MKKIDEILDQAVEILNPANNKYLLANQTYSAVKNYLKKISA
jgi:hypothetical protein